MFVISNVEEFSNTVLKIKLGKTEENKIIAIKQRGFVNRYT